MMRDSIINLHHDMRNVDGQKVALSCHLAYSWPDPP